MQLWRKGVEHFYVGNNGSFDCLVQGVLKELSCSIDINYSIVLSRIDEVALSCEQSATIFPAELDFTIPKFAISKRNEWLIKNFSVVVAHFLNTATNSGRWAQKASKNGLAVINLAKG